MEVNSINEITKIYNKSYDGEIPYRSNTIIGDMNKQYEKNQ